MLVNFKEILQKAKEGKYAVPHFNINNLEWTKYILEECQELEVPVILGVSEGAIRYMGGYRVVSSLVRSLIIDLDILIPWVLLRIFVIFSTVYFSFSIVCLCLFYLLY